MKKLDITEKLNFEEAPVLVIKEEEITVDNSAPTVLKIMELMDGDITNRDLIDAAKLLFGKNYNKVLNVSGSFNNLTKIITEAMELATGDEQGE